MAKVRVLSFAGIEEVFKKIVPAERKARNEPPLKFHATRHSSVALIHGKSGLELAQVKNMLSHGH